MDQFSMLEYQLPTNMQGNHQPFQERLVSILKQIAGAIDSGNLLSSVNSLLNMAPGSSSHINLASTAMTTAPVDYTFYPDLLAYDFTQNTAMSDSFGESPATGTSSQSFDWSAFLGKSLYWGCDCLADIVFSHSS
jgi:hypothetical protein